MSFYQIPDQKILMYPESAYLTPLNGDIETANPASYPWYSKLNVIPDGVDWELPKRIKEKIRDIGSGKHPSHIVNLEHDPVDFTINMDHQDARFLVMATGSATSSGNNAQVATITCVAASSITQSDYFLIYGIDGSGDITCYQVWFDIDADGTAPSAITGATATEVDIASTDTAAQVAAKLDTVLEALIFGIDTTDAVCTVTNDNAGAVPTARDYNTGFTFAISTQGDSTHTVTERTSTTVSSIGLHIEYDNGSEDMIVDLRGCVITSYEVTIDYEAKVIKEAVGIRCPYFVVGIISIHPPPDREGMDIAIFADLKESAAAYIIMDGTTDRTPTILKSMTFTIENEIDLHAGIGYTYRKFALGGTGNITMELTGFSQDKELYDLYKDTWDDDNEQYTNASGKLNSVIKVQRDATYDYWTLNVYNWLIQSFPMRLATIGDKLVPINITFEGAQPNSSGYLIHSFTVTDYMEKLVYAVANS